MNSYEIILDSSKNNRLCIFPIKYPDVWKMYQQHVSTFWIPEEIRETEKDRNDFYNNLTVDEQNFLLNILAFFSSFDNLVMDNLNCNFTQEVQIPEMIAFFNIQNFMELQHAITYANLITRFNLGEKRTNKLLTAIHEVPAIKKKAEWAKKWMQNDKSFAERLIAFSIIERVFFFGSFCVIYWLKQRNLLPGVCQANELIQKDETLHFEFAGLLYNKYIEHKISKSVMYEMMDEAVKIELQFFEDSFNGKDLLQMNLGKMKEYIRFTADTHLKFLGYPSKYGSSSCPFKFMENLGSDSKANFFEMEALSYRKSGLTETIDNTDTTSFEEADDF
jgi:ribonucleotide reductase beta subunit family protein with ferritin-like domain